MVTPKQLLLTIESTLLSSSTPSPSDLVELMHAIRSSRSSLQNLLSYPPPRPSDRTEVQSKEVRLPNSASISLDDQDVYLALKLSDDLHLNEIECVRLLVSANQEWGLLGREPWEILRLAIGLWYTERRDLITALYTLLRAVVLDQDIEGDLVADIQKYLEDLINVGLRQRLINLIKELNLEEPAGLGGPNAERFIIDARGAVVERRAVVSRERLILSHCLVLSVLVVRTSKCLDTCISLIPILNSGSFSDTGIDTSTRACPVSCRVLSEFDTRYLGFKGVSRLRVILALGRAEWRKRSLDGGVEVVGKLVEHGYTWFVYALWWARKRESLDNDYSVLIYPKDIKDMLSILKDSATELNGYTDTSKLQITYGILFSLVIVFTSDALSTVPEKVSLLSQDASFRQEFQEIVMAPVNDPNVGGFVNCVRLAWSVHLMLVQDAITPKERVSIASSKYLQNIGSCLEVIFSNNVFQFFLDKVLGTAAYQNDDEDMTYMYNAYLHKLITIFLSEPLARDKVKEVKEKVMTTLSPYRMGGPHGFSHTDSKNSDNSAEVDRQPFISLLEFISEIYQKEPELLSGNDVVWTFVNFAGEDHTNFHTLVAFLKMLGALACSQDGASKVFELLQGKTFRSVSWSTLFDCLTIYADKFKQSVQSTASLLPEFPEGDAKALVAYLTVLRKVVENGNPNDRKTWFPDIEPLFKLLSYENVPPFLKGALRDAIATFIQVSPLMKDTIWGYLEQYDLPVVVGPQVGNATQPITTQVYDMQFELNEIEARREYYPSTISFINLLNALIAEERDLGDRGRRFIGIFRFIYDQVFGPFPQRAYADLCEKWQLVVACLHHFQMILNTFEITVEDIESVVERFQLSTVQQPAQLQPQLPVVELMKDFMSGKTLFRNIMGILSPGVNTIITERTSQMYGNLLEKAVHLSLEIIILVLGKDLQLADYWRPLYQPLDVILSQDQNQIVALLEYVRYDLQPLIQQCSIKIMSALSSKIAEARKSDVVLIFASSRMVGLVQLLLKSHAASSLVEDYASCLEIRSQENQNLDNNSDDLGVLILQLLIDNISRPAPNVTHLLLKFDLDSPIERSVLQPRFNYSCLKVILDMLDKLTKPDINAMLHEFGFQLLYELCVDELTSGPVMDLLTNKRYHFFVKHLENIAVAPLPKRNSAQALRTSSLHQHLIWIVDEDDVVVVFEATDKDHFRGKLHLGFRNLGLKEYEGNKDNKEEKRAWLLKLLTVELHSGDVTNSSHRETCNKILGYMFAQDMNDLDHDQDITSSFALLNRENTGTRTISKSKGDEPAPKEKLNKLPDFLRIPMAKPNHKRWWWLFISPVEIVVVDDFMVVTGHFGGGRALEVLDIIQFRPPEATMDYSYVVSNTKCSLLAEEILRSSASEKDSVYYYSERGDRLINLTSFRDKLWQLSSLGNEVELNDLREVVQQLLRWSWKYNRNLEEQAAQLHMLTGWSQIVEISVSRRLSSLESRTEVLFQLLDASLSASASPDCTLKMALLLTQVALTCMAKLRDDRYLYPAGLDSDAVTCLDVIMFKQLSTGACLSILFKLTLAVLRHDSSEALRRRQYALLLSYFQYCQHVLDPDVPRKMLQLLLGTEQDSEDMDLEKIDKEQAELARSNFSILRKEAQAILDLGRRRETDLERVLISSLSSNEGIRIEVIEVINDATQGSESGKTISHFVLDALICIDHEKFFLSQLQSRGFLRSCLMSISNFSHQDPRRTVESLQRSCTLEAELALMLRVSHKYGKAGAQVLSSMGTLEHLASCKALYMPLKGSLRQVETRFGRELPANVDKQQVIVAPVLRLVLSLTSLLDASDYFEVKNKIVREAIEFVKAHPSLFDRALQENISEADELMMELINLVVGILSKVWPYEENDEYGFVQGLFRMMCDLFSQDSESISTVSSGLSPLNQRRLELKKFHVGFRLSSYLYFQVTKKSLKLQVSDGQSVYHKSGGGQQPTLVLLGHYLSTVTSALERAAEEKSSLLSKIQDINELSRQEVDGIINTFTEKTRASSSDNTSTRRYIAMVEMCQIVGDRDQLVTLLLILAEHVLNVILTHFQDTSYMAGTNGAGKLITYTSDMESKQDLSSLCGKLLPILERLELLNENKVGQSLKVFCRLVSSLKELTIRKLAL
ncbi:hypothetical protein RDABS01_035041 [Bienertia sinuspersici]